MSDELPYIDRADAVNLARNIRETDNIENVTRRGWLSLVDAVLRMDEFISATNAAPQGGLANAGDHDSGVGDDASVMGAAPASAAPSETPRADAIVDAYLDKCDRVFPDGSASEDIERDLREPIRKLERALATTTARRDALMARLNPSLEYVEGTAVGYGEDEIDRLNAALAEARADFDIMKRDRDHQHRERIARPEAAPADFLIERIAWLKREWEAGGNYEHLNTRRKEAIYIAEKLGVKWMPSGPRSESKP